MASCSRIPAHSPGGASAVASSLSRRRVSTSVALSNQRVEQPRFEQRLEVGQSPLIEGAVHLPRGIEDTTRRVAERAGLGSDRGRHQLEPI